MHAPPPHQSGGYAGRPQNFSGPPRNDGYSRGGYSGGGGRRNDGHGEWRDGLHVPAPPNPRTEKELFGDAQDPSKQHTGINFDRCSFSLILVNVLA